MESLKETENIIGLQLVEFQNFSFSYISWNRWICAGEDYDHFFSFTVSSPSEFPKVSAHYFLFIVPQNYAAVQIYDE